MMECCSQEVNAVIVSEMRESKMYAIVADEVRDGKIEKLSPFVSYGKVRERFLAPTEILDTTSITAAIENQLLEKEID